MVTVHSSEFSTKVQSALCNDNNIF